MWLMKSAQQHRGPTHIMSSCQPMSHPRQSERGNRKEVKYTEWRPKWPWTNVKRITGGAEEWRVCAPTQTTAINPPCGRTYVQRVRLQRQLPSLTAELCASRGQKIPVLFSLTQQQAPKWSGSCWPKSINNTDGVWSRCLAAELVVISAMLHKYKEKKKYGK